MNLSNTYLQKISIIPNDQSCTLTKIKVKTLQIKKPKELLEQVYMCNKSRYYKKFVYI